MKIPSYKYKFKQIFKKIGQPKDFDPSFVFRYLLLCCCSYLKGETETLKCFFSDRADVAGNLGRTEKTVLTRWTYRKKWANATYSGSRQYIRIIVSLNSLKEMYWLLTSSTPSIRLWTVSNCCCRNRTSKFQNKWLLLSFWTKLLMNSAISWIS
jgi:hypothetical protein